MAEQSLPTPDGWRAVPVPDPVESPSDAPPPSVPLVQAAPVPAPVPSVVVPGYGAVPLASMVERVMGAIVDALLMLIPIQVLSWLLPQPLELLAGPAVSAVYVIPFLAFKGATIGGKVMGIKCLAVTGERPGMRRSALRWLPLYGVSAVPVVGPLLMLLVGLSPLLDRSGRMQGLHDTIAGTYVVKTGQLSPVQQDF